MMRAFRKVLVQVDAIARANPALDRAVDLAQDVGAAVKIVDVVEELPRRTRLSLTPELQDLLVSPRRKALDALVARTAARASESGKPVTVAAEVLRGEPTIALVREVLRSGHDVLLRSHDVTRTAGAARGFGPVDMQLLRKCPCPVWIVRSTHPGQYGRVLAAIDPNPDDAPQQGLNRKILGLALYLVEQEYRELLVLHVWNIFGEELLRSHASPGDVAAYIDAARQSATNDVNALLGEFETRLGRARVHIERGDPGQVIPAFAREHNVDLVVMGTVARTGIAGFVMGNTAERVLCNLHTSALTVKPDGFVCPITLDDET